jgi:hypothetical protein
LAYIDEVEDGHKHFRAVKNLQETLNNVVLEVDGMAAVIVLPKVSLQNLISKGYVSLYLAAGLSSAIGMRKHLLLGLNPIYY